MDHPQWCDRTPCTATGYSGAHRSAPTSVDPAVKIHASFFATSAVPGVVYVEIRCEQTIVPARAAYAFGRVLSTLGRQANGNGGAT